MIPQGFEVGVDIVEVPRLDTMLATGGSGFLEFCWTEEERLHCAGSAPRLAARWAAKEAAMKALGRGIGEIEPTDIEVVGAEGQRPRLRLKGAAQALAEEQGVDLSLSMSYEETIAIAFVIAVPGAIRQCEISKGRVG